MSKSVRIYEVGPRDGLQNEKEVIAPADKIEFINLLSESGLTKIEATSFVRPGVIPQLSDAAEVYTGISKKPDVTYSALVPNKTGMEKALECKIQEAAVFTAASDSFTKKNINCTIQESLDRFKDVMRLARESSVPVRGYVSTIVECPYEGKIAPEAVLSVCQGLFDLGVYEISLGETIGVAVPDEVSRLLEVLLKKLPAQIFAGHFHDTRGTALANVFRSLEFGIRVFDSSSGGLGGCPYAPGASGNLGTEDLVYGLSRSGYETGVDPVALAKASLFMQGKLNRTLSSRVLQAYKKR